MSTVVEPQQPSDGLELAQRENGQKKDEKKELDKSQEGSSAPLLKKNNSEVPAGEKKEDTKKDSQVPQTAVEVEYDGCCAACTCGNRWNAACCVGCLCCDCCDCCLNCQGCKCCSGCDCSRPHVDDVCRRWWGCIHSTLIILLVLAVVAIIVAIVVPLVPAKKTDAGTTAAPTTKITDAPSSPTTAYPGSIISGTIETTANYTADLDDSSSQAYRAFVKDFADTMEAFYSSTNFSHLYDGVTVTQLVNQAWNVEVMFEVRVSELDVSKRPNAYTVLDDELTDISTPFGNLRITGSNHNVIPPASGGSAA